MDGVLSQEEINALLNNTNDSDSGASDNPNKLTNDEKDAIGEIANISMGTAATTLFSLVNQKVEISTPVVTDCRWEDITSAYERPCVFIRIAYTVGLNGSNIMVLKESDVKIITDLMMGGDGTNTEGELGELHLSAISEAMNQMMGSSATSLSGMLSKTIDISPPQADLVDMTDGIDEGSIDEFLSGDFVRITFRMEIGDLVDSEIMQLYPYDFVREMTSTVMNNMKKDATDAQAGPAESAPAQQSAQAAAEPAEAASAGMMGTQPMMGQPMGVPMMDPSMMGQPVNVQQAQFSPFMGDFSAVFAKENIDLIMDVPLDVTVELGRTSKSISEILEFAPGTIIELNKLAGEPIDILVNGKYVAKGEVVVIEENFGVRITDIVK